MPISRFVLFLAIMFFISGFAGLIYESIWTHYLKLFLGHAAYAQSLVLVIFMGGMAAGAYLAAKYSKRWINLLYVYAIVEAIIGLLAFIFHEFFDVFLHFSYSFILPGISNPVIVQFFKWICGALIIFPQTVLLGMTFPLMTAGLVRYRPESSGKIIALLYFVNSIGASLGVLVGGFLFVDWFGLPGTIKSAGLLNITVAFLVYYSIKKQWFPQFETNPPVVGAAQGNNSQILHDRFLLLMLVVAAGTGVASFIYEISWIRMLSLVLGSSTHAFELMLSAFILGIALGGLWIYRVIGSLKNPIRFLAIIQVIMGLMAIATMPLYNMTFDVMQGVVSAVGKDQAGYLLFNVTSHVLALVVMLPATICAGMTLPLITQILLQQKQGEAVIGYVYAFNTLGAILGVILCVHFLMPVTGLKISLMSGALLDIVIGIFVLRYLAGQRWSAREYRIPITAACVFVLSAIVVNFDSFKMASGVYRHGKFYSPDNAELLFHKDGNTATVDLVRIKSNNEISIITNGKPDASINVSGSDAPSPDEATMVLLAALPLSVNPDSRTAAVVGLGSGLTSHVMLSAESLNYVDTIEIEPAIVEAARGYRERVANVYSSHKSRIYIDDAKSFFSTHNNQYDIIVSEPSNPWVSGVAGLFSTEFYSLASSYLTDNGVFAQWLQLYEIDLPLIASVTNAISESFEDYAIYAANNQDIIILAVKNGKVPLPSERIFSHTQIASELMRVRVGNVQDIVLRKLGDKQFLDPLFQSYTLQVNSDYYPVLDLGAIKTRFMQKHALQLVTLIDDPVKSSDILTGSNPIAVSTNTSASRFFYPSDLSFVAMIMRDFLLYNRVDNQFYKLPDNFRQSLMLVKSTLLECSAPVTDKEFLTALDLISDTIAPYLSSYESASIWNRLTTSSCLNSLSPLAIKKLHLLLAISKHDIRAISAISEEILYKQEQYPDVRLLSAGMVGSIGLNQQKRAMEIYEKFVDITPVPEKSELLVRLLKSHAENSQAN